MTQTCHTLLLTCQCAPEMNELEFYRTLHQTQIDNKEHDINQIIIQKSDLLLMLAEGDAKELDKLVNKFKKIPHFYNLTKLSEIKPQTPILKFPLLFLNQNSETAWRYKLCFEDDFEFDIFQTYPAEAYKFINNLVKFTKNSQEKHNPDVFKDIIHTKIKESIIQNQSSTE